MLFLFIHNGAGSNNFGTGRGFNWQPVNPAPQNKTVVAVTVIVGRVSLGALISIVIWKSLTGVIYDC